MRNLIEGVIAIVWGTAVVIRVALKSMPLIESGAELSAYSKGSMIGGLLGLLLAIWGIFKVLKWRKMRLEKNEK